MNLVQDPRAVARVDASSPSHFRADIQALRALAISAVVMNHLWPGAVTGGYIGVDVFFVISGFLITSHLLRELAQTGQIALGRFYARRIRRLLPAALLVLLVSVCLVAIFLPYPRWSRNAVEIAASAGYVENWFLAAMSVNYSALNDSASVAQHYWSLSVEEQFYIVWPLVLLGAATFAFRGRLHLRSRVAIALGVVGVGSFAASVLFTVAAPAQAYFVTFTRAWEFAVGGAVALFASRLALSRWAANTLATAGLVAVAASALVYGGETPFPGVAAVAPVLGTAAIIIAGTRHERLWYTPATSAAPVQWLGASSYSLYLWHWPLIVVAPFALSTELSFPMKLGILAVALVLAGVTRRFVETPGQRWSWWSRSVRRSVQGMAIGMVLVLVAAGALLGGYYLRAEMDSATSPLPTGPCAGPRAMERPDACPDRFGPAESTIMTKKNEYFSVPEECGQALTILAVGDELTTHRCDFSGGAPSARVWIVGDSHAQQWQGAIFDLARERGWEVTTSYVGGCPVADVRFVGFRSPGSVAEVQECTQWAREVSDEITSARPDIVFTSLAARLYLVDDGSGRSAADQIAGGLVREWQRWADGGSQVVAIGDPPFNAEVRDVDCIILNASDPRKCARPRAEAQPSDPILIAAAQADNARIEAVDFTSSFCDESNCYAVIGATPVYFDADHLNLQYVRLLAPALARAIDQGAARSPG